MPFSEMWMDLLFPFDDYPVVNKSDGIHPKGCVEALTPSTSECHLICKRGLSRDSQVKIRSVGWDLPQYDQCSYTKGKLDTEMQTKGRHHVKMKAETGVKHLQDNEPRGLSAEHQEPRERRGQILLHGPQPNHP